MSAVSHHPINRWSLIAAGVMLLGARALEVDPTRAASDATYQDIVESSVHPCHRSFLDSIPGGNITNLDRR